MRSRRSARSRSGPRRLRDAASPTRPRMTSRAPGSGRGSEVHRAETAWDGALYGKQFQLTVKPKADCSDGMSDKVYSLEAVLRVDGEVRHGCAEQR